MGNIPFALQDNQGIRFFPANPLLKISPDGTVLAVGAHGGVGNQHLIHLVDLVNWRMIGVSPDPESSDWVGLTDIEFSPDGRLLAGGSCAEVPATFGNCGKGRIYVWETSAGKLHRAPLEGHQGIILTVAIDPKGKSLASGSEDRTVRLWDLVTGQQIGEALGPHADKVLSVAFRADGKVLAAGIESGEIQLWDVDSRERIGPAVKLHKSGVLGVRFTADGNDLVSYERGQLRRWPASFQAWRSRACEVVQRSMSCREWKQYIGEKVDSATCPQWPMPTCG